MGSKQSSGKSPNAPQRLPTGHFGPNGLSEGKATGAVRKSCSVK